MNPKVIMILRLLLGAMMLLFGVDKFFQFLNVPPIPGDGGILMEIYARSGFLTILGVLETLAGIALLVNRFVPIALIITIAILFNATLIHLMYDPQNVIAALLGMIIGIVLVFSDKERYGSLFSA